MVLISGIERQFEAVFSASGGMALLLWRSITSLRLTRNDVERILRQMIVVGWQTLPVALMIGFFSGMILALNTGIELRYYNLQNRIGSIVSLSMVREMGPVFTAFIIIARVGSAMAAELGAMTVSEEVDVLRVLGISVERFLVMPRVLASAIMGPNLTIFSTIVGIWGGKLISTYYLQVAPHVYQSKVLNNITVAEIRHGLMKAFVFALLYSTICCFQGLNSKDGPEGVGRATTSAVVLSFCAVMVADYLLTRFLLG